jgi:hypothetical protein
MSLATSNSLAPYRFAEVSSFVRKPVRRGLVSQAPRFLFAGHLVIEINKALKSSDATPRATATKKEGRGLLRRS